MKKGLLMVFTGNGKGKTTAALGLALRALGHGYRICMIQFIKSPRKYGELEGLKRFGELIDIHVMGKGFTWKTKDLGPHKRAAHKAWQFAKGVIAANKHWMIILDEFTYALNYKLIPEEDVIDVLTSKPPDLHIVITGRSASQALTEVADLVSDVREVKHPLKAGIKAQAGIEF